MKKKNSLHSLGGMLDGVLARHGIAKQVVATQIVQTANELLIELLSPTAIKDIKALSFKDTVLTLACRHSIAVYDAQGVGPVLGKKLEEEYPNVSFQVDARLKPETFREG